MRVPKKHTTETVPDVVSRRLWEAAVHKAVSFSGQRTGSGCQQRGLLRARVAQGSAHLQRGEFDSPHGLVLGDGEEGGERVEPDVEGVRVAVLVDRPLTAARGGPRRSAYGLLPRPDVARCCPRLLRAALQKESGALFGRVGVPGPHILCLQVLELRVDGEPLLAGHDGYGRAAPKVCPKLDFPKIAFPAARKSPVDF